MLSLIFYLALTTGQTVLTASIEPQLSAAAGNRSTLRTVISPSWVTSAKIRGTSDILWSCIITLTACVYTALHLNVPPQHESKWKFYWRKLKWIAVALFAPEIVLYCALYQFIEARKLAKELNELWNTRQTLPDHDPEMGGVTTMPPKKFSLEYGFFVVMGGIATKSVTKIVDDEDRRFTLTPKAVLYFAQDGVFFDISPGTISDKSKANLLGKGLVCAQVIWFFIQLVTRVAAEYPLALIEIHTVVHVVCALSMYVLWWKKPQDVSEPVVQDIIVEHLGTLAIMVLRLDLELFPKTVEANELYYLREDGIKRSRSPYIWEPDDTTDISEKEMLRWSKVSKWIETYNQKQRDPTKKITPSRNINLRELLRILNSSDTHIVKLVPYALNFPRYQRSPWFSDVTGALLTLPNMDALLIELAILSAVYGGIHLTAWNSHFASKTERLLWKIACFDIVGTVPVGLSYILGRNGFDAIALYALLRHKHRLQYLIYPLLTCYALARIYIVVEAFISLRHVPIGVYAAVPWVQAIPHV